MNNNRYIQVAAAIAAVGASAWLVKFCVVVAMDGDASLGASVLYLVGAFAMLAGCTWVGALLARGQRWPVRVAAIVLSPLLLFVSYAALDAVGIALTGGTEEWVQDEAGIALTGALWLAASVWALRQPRARGAAPWPRRRPRAASGARVRP